MATVTDTNGCVISKSYTIKEPALLTLYQGSKDSTTKPGTMIITPTPSGGNPGNYSYIWKNSAGQTCTSNRTTGEITIGHGAGPNQENEGCYEVTCSDSKGCQASKTYCVRLATSIDQAISSNRFKVNVFPNPNKGTFNLSMSNFEPGLYSVQIINSLGEIISSNKLEVHSEYTEDIEINSSGVFLLRIRNTSHSEFIKIVIQ